MKKSDVVSAILAHKSAAPMLKEAKAFAPTNIALCKYWGKRNAELNLPMTSSLSVALPEKGSDVTLKTSPLRDSIHFNGDPMPADSPFAKRIIEFMDLFRQKDPWFLQINIEMNIPVAAGLASSACGFAALTRALNILFAWDLSAKDLSILARLGSGSAARSLWPGFVEWHAGVQPDGMDSYAEPLKYEWPELCMGLLIISEEQKPLSSRAAMQRTVDTSILYGSWPKKVARDLVILRQALHNKNFDLLAGAAESNALSMHATMLSSWPPICYALPETVSAMQKIWQLRRDGLQLYFTQDAGPNLKLLFLEGDADTVKQAFTGVEICRLAAGI